MAKLTREDVEAFRNTSLIEVEAAAGGLPPGYIQGFEPSIGTDGLLTVGAGIASVEGQEVRSPSTVIQSEHWVAQRIGTLQYYCYVTRNGVLQVDIIAPQYSDTLFYLAHPITGWRFVLTLKLNSSLDIQWANTELDSNISASKLTFAKSVGSQTRESAESGDIRAYMGMDPEGNQVAGTDAVEIAIKEYNSDVWENRANIAMRSGGNVADMLLSGFSRAGGGLYSSIGTIWQTGTNNFANTVLGMTATSSGVVIAAGSSTAREIETSSDSGVTFGADKANNFTGGEILGVEYFTHIDTAFAFTTIGELSSSADDGDTWSALIANAFDTAGVDITGIAYDSVNGKLVMVGDYSAGNCGVLISSDDGATWTLGSSIPAVNLKGIAYVGDGILVAQRSSTQEVFISADGGDTWGSAVTVGSGSYAGFGIAYGAGKLISVWVSAGIYKIYYSSDEGRVWTLATLEDNTETTTRPVFIGIGFIAGMHISFDGGVTWSLHGATNYSGGTIPFRSAVYLEDAARVVAGANTGVTVYSDWLTPSMSYSAPTNQERVVGEYIFTEDNELDYSASFTDGMAAATVTFTELPSATVAILVYIQVYDSGAFPRMRFKRSSGGTQTIDILGQWADGGNNALYGTWWLPTSGNTIYADAVASDVSRTFKIIGYKVSA